MNEKNNYTWHDWIPRLFAVVGISFLSLFALDVFGEYDSIWLILVGFFMHSIPTLLLLAATIIAWRHRVIGGSIFIVLGMISIVFFKTYDHPLTLISISLPPIVVGLLFIWNATKPQASTQPQEIAA